ncbi:MAG: hypothetical protein N2035_00450 [Chthoniobacterales bacterium]|nr:hypothetical protein [Chthoniobacterales bacterium]
MLTLRGITGLPARKIGMLRFADYTWLRKEYPSCSTILDEWVRLRERCLTDPEFFRKMRLQTSWAQSEYLFPSSRGGPSRLRVTSKKQPYQTSLTQITNRSSQSYEKGKCYRTEAIILDGEIFFLSELDHTKKESLFLNPKAVLIEAWFRKTESGWEGPFYVPFD